MNTTKYELVQVGDEVLSPFRGVQGNSYTFVATNNIVFASDDKQIVSYDPSTLQYGDAQTILTNTSSTAGSTYSETASFSVTDDLIAAAQDESVAVGRFSTTYNSYLKVFSAEDGSEVSSVLIRTSTSQDSFEDPQTQFLSSGNVVLFDRNNGSDTSSVGTAPILYIVNPETGAFETVSLSGHDVLNSNAAEIVELANGNVVVAYQLVGNAPSQLKASIVSQDGQILVEDADLLPAVSNSPDVVVEIEALPSGGFVVASEKALQFYDAFGATVDNPVSLDSDLHADFSGVIVDSMSVVDEGFIVVTLSPSTGGGQPNSSAIFNFDGELVGDPQDLGLSDWGFREYVGATGETLGTLDSGYLVFANDYVNEASVLFDINAIAEGSVSIAGDLFVEDTLTATPTAIDEDGVDESSWTYQWYIAGDTDEMIAGATGATIELTSETAGKEVFVEASFTDLLGNISTFVSETTDTITGVFSAEAGGSQLIGTALAEIFNGAEGDDTIFANGGDDTISGEAGADQIRAGAGLDTVVAGEGNDIVYGDADNDSLLGGNGADELFGGFGKDKLFGEDGDDVLSGGDQNDLLEGGAGADTLNGDSGKDRLFGGAGDDDLSGGDQNDQVYGGEGADVLAGDGGKDKLYGGDDNDTLSGGDKNDILNGDGGADVLSGDGGKDKLSGGDGADVLSGGDKNDVLNGDTGNDTLKGDGGKDTLNGGGGNDDLDGGAKNDRLFGEDGDDFLFGDKGKDALSGGVGNDTLDGGRQNDVLTGGAEADTFMMDIGYKGKDRITDFDGTDTLIFYKNSEALDFDAESFVVKFASETSEGVQFSFGKRKQLLVEGVFTAEELIDNISFDYL